MSTARTGAAAVLLPDGRILITGGVDASGAPLAGAEYFNPDGSFSPAPPMSTPRTGHAAVWLLTGEVLVIGGTTSGGGITNSAEAFDPLTDSWRTLPAAMLEARTGHTVSQLQDGSLIIVGGTNSAGPLSALERFEITDDSFNPAGALVTARKAHVAAALLDGRVLIAGGTDASGATLSSSEIYDPVSGAVSLGPTLNSPRANAGATTLLDGKVLISGGSYPEGAVNGALAELVSAEIFDPVEGAINAAPSSLATARAGHQAFLLPNNANVLIVGGTFAGQDLSLAELYVPWTGQFQPTAAMASAHSGAAGSALNSTSYPVSGTDGLFLLAGGSNLSSAELYGFATVKTDQHDYVPGETVIVTGSGWRPGETVTLSLVELPNVDSHGPWTTTADANGYISDSSFTTNASDRNVRFYLTAVGSQSQAQTTFTDATSFGNPSVGAQSPAGVVPGGSATFPVVVNFTGSGTCTISLSVTSGLPAGTSVLFNPASGTGTSSADSLSSTLTLTPPVTATPNSYVFNVRATGTAGNCNLNTRNGTGTLAVSGPATGLQVAGFPSPIQAGTPASFTVTAIDAHGNVAAGYTGTVHFTSSDTAAVLPANYTFTGAGPGLDNGSHTFNATFNTVASNQTITATDSVNSLSSTQSHINVTAPPTVAITVTTSPANLQVSIDGGAAQTAPVSANWVPGSTHTIATTSPQSGTAGTQYVWTSWSDGGAQSHPITVPSTNTVYTANFGTQYKLTRVVNPSTVPGGEGNLTPSITTGTGDTSTNWYDSGAVVSIAVGTDIADGTGKRWRFDHWSGDASGTTSPVSVTMTAPRSVTANYVAQYQLTLATNPAAVGTSNITPSPTSSDGFYDDGTSVQLTAAAMVDIVAGSSRYKFKNWTGDVASPPSTNNPVSVTMDKARSVTANYDKQYKLTLETAPDTGIGGTGNPSASPSSADGFYNENDVVSVSATALVDIAAGSSRWRFDHWSGGATGSTSPVNVTMDAAKTVTANYVKQFYVTFTQSGIGGDTTANVLTAPVAKTVSQLGAGFSDWFDKDTAWSFAELVPTDPASDKRYRRTSAASGTITAAGTITGTYVIQYKLTLATGPSAGIGGSSNPSASPSSSDGFYDVNTVVSVSATTPVAIDADSRWRFDHWSGGASGSTNPVSVTMSGPKTVTANYVKQWQLTFTQSGIGTDTGTNTVLTINGSVTKAANQLPFSDWFDESSSVSYSFSAAISTVPVSDKQYELTSVTGTASPITVNAAATITGNYTLYTYSLQYLPPLDQSTASVSIVNTGKNGRVIPVKVVINKTSATSSVAILSGNVLIGVNFWNCNTGAYISDSVDLYADAGSSSAGTNLFRLADGYWIYNLDTKALGFTTNACYRLDVYYGAYAGSAAVKLSSSTWAIFKPTK
ncbi:MAG: kelch repeat-containing protein [Terriglobales bacterium]